MKHAQPSPERRAPRWLLLALPLALLGGGKSSDDTQRARVELGIKEQLAKQVAALQVAAEELERVAPTPPGRGWDASQDAPAIGAMTAAWTRGRVAYELIEGAVLDRQTRNRRRRSELAVGHVDGRGRRARPAQGRASLRRALGVAHRT
ncbi:MAG TPA: hypothetical protein VGJ91_24280 [Polyangiaceae bacterium]